MNRQVPPGPKGLWCPFWQKEQIKVCGTCPLWIQVRGKDPNTGAEHDHWNCSLAWLPTLLIENAKETRQGAAATESFRNEMVERADAARRDRLSIRRVAADPLLIEAS